MTIVEKNLFHPIPYVKHKSKDYKIKLQFVAKTASKKLDLKKNTPEDLSAHYSNYEGENFKFVDINKEKGILLLMVDLNYMMINLNFQMVKV